MRCPFTLIVGDEGKLRNYVAQWDIAEALSRTRLVEPNMLDEEFPRIWAWPDIVCSVFPRPFRWRQESLHQNLLALCGEAKRCDGHIVLQIDFESDLRRLDLPLDPSYILRL
ncbi:MAG: hypothetical protein J0M28_00180 [Thauera sp.]|nr:hypothetical protein [Thauera sp.]